jgi:hypothetical protein
MLGNYAVATQLVDSLAAPGSTQLLSVVIRALHRTYSLYSVIRERPCRTCARSVMLVSKLSEQSEGV